MMQKENCEKRKSIQKEHRGLCSEYHTVKPVLSGHSKRTQKSVSRPIIRLLMQFKTFDLLNLPFVIKAFLSFLSGRLRQVLMYC